MISRNLTFRLCTICILSWLVVIGLYDNALSEPDTNCLMTIYGIVTDVNVDANGNGILILLKNGANSWHILFNEPSQIPEINRAVIITVKQASDNLLVAISFNYP